ncbi:isocitrate/isopropylmalate family dehydrogenase, partial [Clostridioides difficile]
IVLLPFLAISSIKKDAKRLSKLIKRICCIAHITSEKRSVANLRPIKSFKGIKSRYEDVDLVVVRENTEDLYAGIEHKIGDYA